MQKASAPLARCIAPREENRMELNMKDEGFRFNLQGSGLYSTSPVVRLPTVPGTTAPCTNSFTSWTRNVVVYGDYIVLL